MKNWQVAKMKITDEQIQNLYEQEKKRVLEISDETVFGKNLWNYYQFVSWAKWYPDRFVELFKSGLTYA